jgi:hypothetical protein
MKAFFGALLLGGLALSAGCSDDDSPSVVDEVTDPNCSEICDRYDECVLDIDVGTCVDQCDDLTDNDLTDAQSDRCADCVDDANCTEAATCWDDCIVVPEMMR